MPGRRVNPSLETIRLDRERLIIVKAIIEAMRAFGGPVIGTERFGAEATWILLGMAIYVGQCEGRHMNASKLSAYVGIPRSTVIRKLSELERIGVLDRHGNGYALRLEFLDHPERVTNGKRAKRYLNDAVARLSKLGS